jgi:gluconokinase
MPHSYCSIAKRPIAIVLMGAAGSGKSTLGRRLADAFNVPYLEGDDFHPASNVAKMAAGDPLLDTDRWPWLDALGIAVGAAAQEGGLAVAACSALRRVYREHLMAAARAPICWIYLKGTPELLRRRMSARRAHFMPVSLLESQLATLEPPGEDEQALTIDASQSAGAQLEIAQRWARDLESTHFQDLG